MNPLRRTDPHDAVFAPHHDTAWQFDGRAGASADFHYFLPALGVHGILGPMLFSPKAMQQHLQFII